MLLAANKIDEWENWEANDLFVNLCNIMFWRIHNYDVAPSMYLMICFVKIFL
jgi:hypothetical protein